MMQLKLSVCTDMWEAAPHMSCFCVYYWVIERKHVGERRWGLCICAHVCTIILMRQAKQIKKLECIH